MHTLTEMNCTTQLQARAADADAAGELQTEQVRLIHDKQWLRMLAPRALGGLELALPDVVRLEEAIAQADGSCGWVVTLCAGAGWFAGFWPETLGRQILQTSDLCLAGSGAPTGFADRDGEGWRLNGRWLHASGAQLATHYTLNAQLREGGQALLHAQGQPRICAFVVPAALVQAEADSWHSIGLRASTSRAFSLRHVHVSAQHAFVIDAAHATAPGPLYSFPFMALAFVTLGACVLGMAQHFLTLARPLTERRIGHLGGPSATAQALWQSSHHALQVARTDFYEALDQAWQANVQGQRLSSEHDNRLARTSLALVRCSREVVDGLYPLCGLHAADPRTEINRVWRDFHTASQHTLWLRQS
jgi:alkylation response protein AidB-like acyl-CoA dehydrogenase